MLRFVLILGMLISVASCKEESQKKAVLKIDQPENTPKIVIEKKPSKPVGIMIYDRRSDGTMAYREVPVDGLKKDAVRDAIVAFIDQSQFEGDYRNVRLHRIGMINRKANFAFAGEVNFTNKASLKDFRLALDSTIIYHYKNKNYSVHLNGTAW